jgi:hypothetical protein
MAGAAEDAMSKQEDAQSLQWLTEEFGHEFGRQIFETIQTEYGTRLPDIKPKYRTVSSINKMIDNIISSIHPIIERAIATAIASGDENDVKIAGDIADKAIIRKYYITLFLSKYYESVRGTPELKSELKKNIDRIRKRLFPILFDSLIDRSNTWLCDRIDELIKENKAGFPEPPRPIRDEAESARSAVIEVIGQRRMQEQMQPSDDQTMTLGMAAAPSEFPPLFAAEEPLDEDEKLRQDIREAILNIEKSEKIDLGDRSTHGLVFTKIFDMPPFDSMKGVDTPKNREKFEKMQDIFWDDIELLLSERQGAPPSVIFSPGIPTSRQLERRLRAEQLGWRYGPLPRGAVALFPDPDKKDPDPDKKDPDPDKKDPDPDKKGGNKRMMIKSKKNSKMHSKNKRRSKRRSNTRRRRRNSYK